MTREEIEGLVRQTATGAATGGATGGPVGAIVGGLTTLALGILAIKEKRAHAQTKKQATGVENRCAALQEQLTVLTKATAQAQKATTEHFPTEALKNPT